MHFDPKEILFAWKSKLNPTENQVKLAELRANICNECEFMKIPLDVEAGAYCDDCGCFLKAKVYSYREGACPKGKWDEIDRKFRNTEALKVLKNPKSKLV